MIEHLPLDSDLFGLPVYRSDGPVAENGLTMVFLDGSRGDVPLSTKVEMVLDCSKFKKTPLGTINVVEHKGAPTQALLELSKYCGSNSRFHRCPHTKSGADKMMEVWISNLCVDPNADIFVIKKSVYSGPGDEVGFIAIKGDRIVLLSRDRGYKRMGLAYTLISRAIEEIAKDYKMAHVSTQKENGGAVSLYKACGFEILEEKQIYHEFRP